MPSDDLTDDEERIAEILVDGVAWRVSIADFETVREEYIKRLRVCDDALTIGNPGFKVDAFSHLNELMLWLFRRQNPEIKKLPFSIKVTVEIGKWLQCQAEELGLAD